MLDLKAKLLQAGLVTDDQVEKVQAEQTAEQEKKKAERARRQAQPDRGRQGKGKGGPKKGGPRKPAGPQKSDDERWAERVKKLAEGGKSEQYDAIRGWVERTRLDPDKAVPSENAERFHFGTYDETISWLTLEPELVAKLKDNTASICGFMSFNGLRHCVLPVEVARDIAKIRPEWPRHLEGAEILVRPPPEPKAEGEGAEATGENDAKASDEKAPASADSVTSTSDVASPEVASPEVASPEVASPEVASASVVSDEATSTEEPSGKVDG